MSDRRGGAFREATLNLGPPLKKKDRKEKKRPGPVNAHLEPPVPPSPAPSNKTYPDDLKPLEREVEEADLGENDKTSVKDFLFNKGIFLQAQKPRLEDFQRLERLGSGNSGAVNKVCHKPTSLILAEKIIRLEVRPEVRNRILRELQILHDCSSPSVVGFFGSFWSDGEIHMLLEYMDAGSLDAVLLRVGRIPENVTAVITLKVVEGLLYLYHKHNVIHRDIKPSNILINTDGAVKLCDFGVSGELHNSLANSFVGTRSYMAPERLLGTEYNVESDVWSLGMSLIELATGIFPLPASNLEQPLVAMRKPPKKKSDLGPPPKDPGMVIFELLTCIVEGEPPQVPKDKGFSDEFVDFVDGCLKREPRDRMTLADMHGHPFITDRDALLAVDMAAWARSTMVEEVLTARLEEKAQQQSASELLLQGGRDEAVDVLTPRDSGSPNAARSHAKATGTGTSSSSSSITSSRSAQGDDGRRRHAHQASSNGTSALKGGTSPLKKASTSPAKGSARRGDSSGSTNPFDRLVGDKK